MLFDQYLYQIKNVTDFSSPRVLDFEREIYFVSVAEEHTNQLEGEDMRFYLNPFFTITKRTNRENHTKVIINVLNCLNFWFNFCVFNLYSYLQKFFGLSLKLYGLLRTLKSKLNTLL